MLYGLLVALFIIICVLLIAIILVQQAKGSIGLGGLGGGAQMLFGGSGGQDVFQKTTWILGALFMVGSLSLTLLKTRQVKNYGYRTSTRTRPIDVPAMPTERPGSVEL